MTRKIILLGCGGVGKPALYYIPRILHASYKNVYVIDKSLEPKSFPTVQQAIKKGATFIHHNITSRNFEALLTKKIQCNPGDVILDLTTHTDCYSLFKISRKLQLHYLCTSIEEEHIKCVDNSTNNSSEQSIWMQHAKLFDVAAKTSHYGHASSCVEMGMNPGLISIFIKQGILDIASCVIKRRVPKTNEDLELLKKLQKYVRSKDYRRIGELLQINTIHCSEIDTQVGSTAREKKFVNTWSCVGLLDEANEIAEYSVGTHEKTLPFQTKDINEIVPGLVTIAKPSMRTIFRTYVPKRVNPETHEAEFIEIKGTALHHGEAISLNRFLSTDTWTPTMHYVYKMSPATRKVLNKLKGNEFNQIAQDPSKWKVLNVFDDNINGTDNVGATFFLPYNPLTGERKPWAYWCGSIMDTEYTQNILRDKYFGPTPIQVVAGILTGAKYLMKYPKRDLMFPEDIPESFILKHAKKYLGCIYSAPVTGCKIRGTTMQDLIVK